MFRSAPPLPDEALGIVTVPGAFQLRSLPRWGDSGGTPLPPHPPARALGQLVRGVYRWGLPLRRGAEVLSEGGENFSHAARLDALSKTWKRLERRTVRCVFCIKPAGAFSFRRASWRSFSARFLPDRLEGDTMRRSSLSFLGLLAVLSLPHVTHAASFTEIIDPNNLINYADSAPAVSADGSTVVGTLNHNGALDQQPYRWTQATGAVGLGWLNSNPHSFGMGVSADGSVVIGTDTIIGGSEPDAEAFRWTATGGLIGLGDIPPSSIHPGSSATAVTSDGLTVFGSSTSGAYQWTQSGGMVLLQPSNFFPFGASGDGSVLVGQQSSQAVRWTQAAGIMGLGFLPNTNVSLAYAVSRDGTTAVGYSGFAQQAFRWTQASGMVGLGSLSGLAFSVALAVSADGSEVVGYANNGGPANTAFIWDPVNGLRNFQQVLTSEGVNLTGWTLEEATGISADGNTIVGEGVDPNGFTTAWIAVVPEPSTALLLSAGVAGLAVRRRRARGAAIA
jgi:probable HAF family extracellular repeat protein